MASSSNRTWKSGALTRRIAGGLGLLAVPAGCVACSPGTSEPSTPQVSVVLPNGSTVTSPSPTTVPAASRIGFDDVTADRLCESIRVGMGGGSAPDAGVAVPAGSARTQQTPNGTACTIPWTVTAADGASAHIEARLSVSRPEHTSTVCDGRWSGQGEVAGRAFLSAACTGPLGATSVAVVPLDGYEIVFRIDGPAAAVAPTAVASRTAGTLVAVFHPA